MPGKEVNQSSLESRGEAWRETITRQVDSTITPDVAAGGGNDGLGPATNDGSLRTPVLAAIEHC